MDERLEFYLKRHSDACGCKDLKLSHQEITTVKYFQRSDFATAQKKWNNISKITSQSH
jgi:CRP/FNR family transcriptional regulator